jgi:predicted alpha/beta-fold hydrolase
LKGIVDRCPSLSSRYWPTWYAHPRDLQFLLLGLKEFRARLLQRRPYKRQVLRLNDGAPIALDWVPATRTQQDDGLQPYPVCVLLHGMAQDSSSATMIDLACSLAKSGLHTVVMNRRSYGGIDMEDEENKISIFGFDEDLDEVRQ